MLDELWSGAVLVEETTAVDIDEDCDELGDMDAAGVVEAVSLELDALLKDLVRVLDASDCPADVEDCALLG